MNRVLDVRRSRSGRRAPEGLAPTVSVLRWPSGALTGSAFEMFSAQESGRFEREWPDAAYDGENVLLVSASRRVAPDIRAVRLSFVNVSPSQAVKLSIKLAGRAPTSLVGTILTAPQAAAMDGFDVSRVAQPALFHGAVLKERVVEITVPARSVVVLIVE